MRSKLVPILLNSVPGWVRNAYPGVWPTISLAAHFDTGNYWAQGLGQVSADTLFSCTRASTKYVANGAGVLLPIATGLLPVADGAGNLVEQAATNLQLHSQTFSDVYWGAIRATGTDNVTTAPDGTTTGASFTENNQNSDHFFRALTSKATSAITYTLSIYLKPNTRTAVRVFSGGSDETTNGCYADINLANGTIFASGALGAGLTFISATIKAASSGWYRVALTLTSDTANSIDTILALQNPVGTTSYQGDGTSGIYVWGAQLEASAFATSYIPTTTVAVTRAADSISLTTAASNLIPITTATLLFNMGAVPWGNDGADHILLAFLQSGSTPGVGKFSGGTIAFNDGVGYRTSQAYINGAAFKYAVAYGGSDINSSLGGGTVSNYASYAGSIAGTAKPFKIGSGSGSAYWNGTFKRITVFSSQLSGVQLQALTQ